MIACCHQWMIPFLFHLVSEVEVILNRSCSRGSWSERLYLKTILQHKLNFIYIQFTDFTTLDESHVVVRSSFCRFVALMQDYDDLNNDVAFFNDIFIPRIKNKTIYADVCEKKFLFFGPTRYFYFLEQCSIFSSFFKRTIDGNF